MNYAKIIFCDKKGVFQRFKKPIRVLSAYEYLNHEYIETWSIYICTYDTPF